MALDKRAHDLARIVVDYSTEIKSEDTLIVRGENTFREFGETMGNLAEERGASVIYGFTNLSEKKAMIERNDHVELKAEVKKKCELIKDGTACVYIEASTDPYCLKDVEPRKIAEFNSIVAKPQSEMIMGNGKEFRGMKWNVVGFPCEAEAKSAGMTLDEYADFVYNATNIDWTKTTAKMNKVKDEFDNADDVHVHVPGMTDLHLSLEGRGGGVCDGKYNMPDGEVFYGPIEDSANGYITFPYTSIRSGNAISNIKLTYKDGEVVDCSAEKNQKFLESMLDLKGVKRIGEFGIGCNYGIDRYIKSLLFDEKIGGTIHVAVGDSYKDPLSEGGGLNNGDIHWDLVCDLRHGNNNPGGELYVNNNLVQKNGCWMFR